MVVPGVVSFTGGDAVVPGVPGYMRLAGLIAVVFDFLIGDIILRPAAMALTKLQPTTDAGFIMRAATQAVQILQAAVQKAEVGIRSAAQGKTDVKPTLDGDISINNR